MVLRFNDGEKSLAECSFVELIEIIRFKREIILNFTEMSSGAFASTTKPYLDFLGVIELRCVEQMGLMDVYWETFKHQ